MTTMTTQQALNVLKKYASTYQSLFPASKQEYDEALTIAIECMEARKEEIMKAFNAGYANSFTAVTAEQYYNSLTKTEIP